MPLFEYKCDDCGKQFEELVSSSQTAVTCPHCGSTKTSKQLSVFAAGSGGSSTGSSCSSPGCGSGFS